MPSELRATIYTPSSALRDPRKLLGEMFAGLVSGRGLAWRLFLRDTKAAYRQSMLGYAWAFMPPLATAATFVFLNTQQILSVGQTPVPYPAYVLIGTVLWQTFVEALNSPIRTATSSRALLVKVNFPREALLIAGLLGVMFNFLVRIVLLVAVFVFFDLPLTGSLWFFPLGLAAVVLLGLSLGVILTPLALLYTDVARAIGIITGFWLFLTPVVYPPPKSGLAAYLTTLNPASPVIVTTRDWLISLPPEHIDGFLVVTACAFVLLFIGWLIYHVALPHLIERMGG